MTTVSVSNDKISKFFFHNNFVTQLHKSICDSHLNFVLHKSSMIFYETVFPSALHIPNFALCMNGFNRGDYRSVNGISGKLLNLPVFASKDWISNSSVTNSVPKTVTLGNELTKKSELLSCHNHL